MRKLLAVEASKCTGCEICVLVCSFKHYNEFNPRKANLKVFAWHRMGISTPIICNQCETPYCALSCPTEALVKNPETGVVNLNYEKCIGCKMCVTSCPFGMIYITPRETLPQKCDYCNSINHEPWCAELCPTGAISYLSEDQLGQSRRQLTAMKLVNATLAREIEPTPRQPEKTEE